VILLLQLKRIGDLVLTTPAIAAVREKFPNQRIELVVNAGTRELLPAVRGVDKFHIWKGTPADVQVAFTLWKQKYDYCFDFTRNDRSAFLTFLSGATKRVTADHPQQREKLRVLAYNELYPCSIDDLHTADYHLCLLRAAGIQNAQRDLQLHLPENATAAARHLLHSAGLPNEFVVVHPGSARADKFWRAEAWAEVIDHCSSRGFQVVLTGGTWAVEQHHIAEIRQHARSSFTDLSGKLPLLTFAAVIAQARLVITVDSAPVHFASALRVPQVALFGPTNPLHWRPQFEPSLVLHGSQHAPVSQFTPNQQPAPTTAISTQQVIDAMETLLRTPRRPPE
jgi:heptosyltransferase III